VLGVVELDTLAGGQAIAPHLDRYPARVVAPKRNRCSIPGTNYEATQAAALRFVCSDRLRPTAMRRVTDEFRDQPPGFRDRLSKQKIEELFERAFDGK
jgi:hypothetical protein